MLRATSLAALAAVVGALAAPAAAPATTLLDAQSMVAADGRVFAIGGRYLGPPTGSLAVVDASTGAILAFPELTNAKVTAATPDGAGGFYVGTGLATEPGSGLVIHVGADGSRDPRFSSAPLNAVRALVTSRDHLYVAVQDGPVVALDLTTGASDPAFRTDVTAHDLTLAGGHLWATALGTSGNRLGCGLRALDPITGARDEAVPCPTTRNGIRIATDGASVFLTIYLPQGIPGAKVLAVDAATGRPLAGFRPPQLNNDPTSLTMLAGRLAVSGSFSEIGSVPRRGVALLDSVDGHLDRVLSINGGGGPMAVAGNDIYVGGTRYDADGRPVPGFAVTTYSAPDVLVAGGGRLLLGGVGAAGGLRSGGVFALDAAGVPDPAFAITTLLGYLSTGAAAGPRLYLAGSPNVVDSVLRPNLLAVDTRTGHLDPAFAPIYAGDRIEALAVTGDRLAIRKAGGRIVVFDAHTGAQDRRFGVVHLDTAQDGQLLVYGRWLYVTGAFDHVQGVRRDGIAALDLRSGRLIRSFRPGRLARDGRFVSGAVVAAIARSGRTLYVGGWNLRPGGRRPVQRLLAMDARTGRVSRTFRPTGLGGDVHQIEVSGDLLVVSSDHGLFVLRRRDGRMCAPIGGHTRSFAVLDGKVLSVDTGSALHVTVLPDC